ncbi:MAG: DUF7379 domain-containing protein [Flavobacteriales bacterium]
MTNIKNRIQIFGTKEEINSDNPNIETKACYSLSTNRSESNEIYLNITSEDVIKIELENNESFYLRPDEFETFIQTKVDVGKLRSYDDLSFQSTNRGFIKDFIKKIFIQKAMDVAADKIIEEVILPIEKKLANGEEGLYKYDGPKSIGDKITNPNAINTDNPILIFLHGTASSTLGSFSELDDVFWKEIRAKYGQEIYTLEHFSLSKTPIENAIDLVSSLPKEAHIHTISHSRGGLISELIAWKMIKDKTKPFSSDDFKFFDDQKYGLYKEQLKVLNDLLVSKNIRLTRSIRVACPVSGTKLMTKRLDRAVNIFFYLLGKIPGLKPITYIIEELLLQVTKHRLEVDVLPGLEAMHPKSGLIALLNSNPSTKQMEGELVIISGDSKFGFGAKTAFINILTSLYFNEYNDFVVDSLSMFGGTHRTSMYYKFYQSKHISHFRYFSNNESRSDILLALNRTSGIVDGFKPFNQDVFTSFETEGIRGKRLAPLSIEAMDENKPSVYIIPGIMGSKLKFQDEKVWLHIINMMSGRFSNLEITDGLNEVEPYEVMGMAYRKMVSHFGKDYNALPFPYDWRISLKTSAKILAEDINNRLNNTNKPIHIMAHSMGGMVVHALYTYHKSVWQKLNARKENKIIFLGTPFRGSYEIISVLLKKNKSFKKLHQLDLKHNSNQMLKIISSFQGMLDLMPMKEREHDEDFYDTSGYSIWEKMQKSIGKDFIIPDSSFIAQTEQLHKDFMADPIQGDHIIYIAGKDKYTPCDLHFDDENKLHLVATSQGDGKVTYDSGILNTFKKVYYIPVTHGKMCDSPMHFQGLVDILQTGETTHFTTMPEKLRSNQNDLFLMPEEFALNINNQHYIESQILGIPLSLEETKQTIKVSMINGDLGNAKYPLVVGHHTDDPILYAEAVVDRYLDGKLSDLYHTSIYPEQIGESLFVKGNGNFNGAIIVGLGVYGQINETTLELTLSQGLIRYALEKYQDELKPLSLGFSSLFIGSYYSGISLEDSIRCVMKSVQFANNRLKKMKHPVFFNEIEFIELYKVKSIQAVYRIREMLKNDINYKTYTFPQSLLKEKSGSRIRINFTQKDTWWHRIQVSMDSSEESSLRFISLTDKARADEKVQPSQLKLIDRLIETALATGSWDEQTSRTLFYLLIPLGFKEYIIDKKNLILVVDDKTAKYPWEILTLPNDGIQKQEKLSIIRQLVVRDTHRDVQYASGKDAFVVGNPKTDPKEYSNLPGAEEEAKDVFDKLTEYSYNVTLSLKDDSLTVINHLFSSAYKIIHLAGHGKLDEDNPTNSGVVLSDDLFISVAEINSLPYTPEFVFINCCHLGSTLGIDTNYNKLAATIGIELIKKGVKAIIVTGWAVDDVVAKEFARIFYSNLLNHTPFGESVKFAREETSNSFPNSNTWGAYQCYGNPFYVIPRKDKNPTQQTTKGRTYDEFVDHSEVLIELYNIKNQIEPSSTRDKDKLEKQLQNLLEKIPNVWMNISKIIEGLANCYYELSNYPLAIIYYEKLRALWDANANLSSLENLSKIKTKQAVKDLRSGAIKASVAKKRIQEAEVLMDQLLKIGETEKRYYLKAGNYKRLAMVENSKEHLKHAKEAYEDSLKINNVNNNYALLNVLTMSRLQILFTSSNNVNKKIELDFLTRLETRMNTNDSTFWNDGLKSAINMYKMLDLSIDVSTKNELAKNVLKSYKLLWSKGGSFRKLENILNHIEFILTILNCSNIKSLSKAKTANLTESIKLFTTLENELQSLYKK